MRPVTARQAGVWRGVVGRERSGAGEAAGLLDLAAPQRFRRGPDRRRHSRLTRRRAPEAPLRFVDAIQTDQGAGTPAASTARGVTRENVIVVLERLCVAMEPSEDAGTLHARVEVIGPRLDHARICGHRLVQAPGSREGARGVERGRLAAHGLRRRQGEAEQHDHQADLGQPVAQTAEDRVAHGARSSRTGGSSWTRPGTRRPTGTQGRCVTARESPRARPPRPAGP